MAYFRGQRKPRSRVGVKRKVMRKRAPGSAFTMAKKALRLANQVAAGSTELKYYTRPVEGDLAHGGAGSNWGSPAVALDLSSTHGCTKLFNSGGITGNKTYLKYLKGTWEIHMDNINNEEETCNFQVSIVKLRSDADANPTGHVSEWQGQIFFDPRYVQVLYKRHFTLTMGGTSPGTAGQSTRYGKFYIPVNKMIRYSSQGVPGEASAMYPASMGDRIYLLVHTDNTTGDGENPRINGRVLSVFRDTDTNV